VDIVFKCLIETPGVKREKKRNFLVSRAWCCRLLRQYTQWRHYWRHHSSQWRHCCCRPGQASPRTCS